MDEFLAAIAGGKTLVALAVAGLGVFRWLVGRSDAQFSRRRDFLQHWRDPADLDPLSAEVLVRQLFGTYLPATLIHKICALPNIQVASTLRDLSEAWSLLEWNSEDSTLKWRGIADSQKRLLWGLVLLFIAYVVFAFLGTSLLLLIHRGDFTPFTSVVGSAWGVMFLIVAVTALWSMDKWNAALRIWQYSPSQFIGISGSSRPSQGSPRSKEKAASRNRQRRGPPGNDAAARGKR